MPELRTLTMSSVYPDPYPENLPSTVVDLRIYGEARFLSVFVDRLVRQSHSDNLHKDENRTISLPRLEYLRLKIKSRFSDEYIHLCSLLRALLLVQTSLHLHLILRDGENGVSRDQRADLARTFGERVNCDDTWPPTYERMFFNSEY